jgi:ParB family chromosome partitioning protein
LEKLDRTAEKIAKEGWKWVEARIAFDWQEQNKLGHIYPGYKGSKEIWPDKDKTQAGAVVTISHNGQTEIHRGRVKPEDRKAAEKASKGKGKVNGGKKVSDRKPGDLTFAAVQRLQAEGGAIVATQVAKAPDIALKLFASELADDVFYEGHERPRTWVHIARGNTNRMPGIIAGALEEKCAAAKGMDALESEWAKKLPKKRSEARAWIFEQDTATVLQLLAFLIAREIDVVNVSADRKGGIVELAAAAGVDLAHSWKPTIEWLATLPKSTVLAMAKDAGAGAVDLATLAKQPKAKFDASALSFFQAGWLPKPLRPAKAASPKKKGAPKQKKAAKPVDKGSAAERVAFPWGDSKA